jgi:hypothetical protein
MDPKLALLYQTLRDVKLQVESLKTMMFEHRPAFVETYNQIAARVAQSDAIVELDRQITELQKAVNLRA